VQDRYDPKSIEPRWQEHWRRTDAFRAGNRPGAPKKYILAMLPYPSGEMHMGHARVYAITDVLARYARKRGFDVLHPFGWDSFGLPAENAAIKEGVHPAIRTPKNIQSFKADVNALGISVDWTTEIATSDPGYYRWNQWFFLRMLERGLVYRRTAKVNFCPVDNTVLANEQVEEGKCWRCGATVIEREIPEWAFRITAYADKLLALPASTGPSAWWRCSATGSGDRTASRSTSPFRLPRARPSASSPRGPTPSSARRTWPRLPTIRWFRSWRRPGCGRS